MKTIEEERFESFISRFNEPQQFVRYRKDSLKRYLKLDMPDFKYGLTIKLNPKNLDFKSIDVDPDPKIRINLDNTDEVKVLHGNAINQSMYALLEPFFNELRKEEDKLLLFNRAFTNNFLLVYIPSGVNLEKPIKINCEVLDMTLISLVLILAEENSDVKIQLNKSAMGNKHYVAEEIRVIVKQNSKVTLFNSSNFNRGALNISRLNAEVERNAQLKIVSFCLGADYAKLDVRSNLAGAEASVENTVIYLTCDNQIYDIYTESVHNAKDTRSNILTRGVVTNKSKALSRSLINISQNAQNSNGYEKQDALIFDDAEADAIPNLEINNNDVKCSHGSTIGKINKDKLFYLMSKGLSEQNAKRVIVQGYFDPFLEALNDKYSRSDIDKSIQEALKCI